MPDSKSDRQGRNPDQALTFKERLFVDFYIGASRGNAADAARRAGYSVASAKARGYELMHHPHIRKAVSVRFADAAMGADEVLARLAIHARASLADALTEVEIIDGEGEDGDPQTRRVQRIDMNALVDSGAIHNIAELSYNQFGPRVKLHDVQGALDKIARAHGLYSETASQTEVIVKVYSGLQLEDV